MLGFFAEPMSNSAEIEKEKSGKRRREEEGGSEKRSKSTGFEPPKQALKEEKGGGGDASRASSSFAAVGDRQRFTVELRPGETTIVSWRKLAKDASKLKGPTSVREPPPSTAHPVLESRIAPGKPSEKELKDETAPHRFSAVIEKIERLYMGKGSSDEEDLNDLPDDNQYDTEDSFIDDAELDEYFEVDNSTTKHNGFFVNRGKLERINEAALPNQQMKKRRRKDMLKLDGESDMHAPHKHAKLAKKTADQLVEVAPVVGNSSNLSRGVASKSDKVDDVKAPNQPNASIVCTKKKPSDTRTLDPSISLQGSNGDVSVSLSEAKHNEKLKVGSHQLKHVGSKLKDARVSSDDSHQKFHERSSHTQVKYKSGKQLSVTDEKEIAVRTKENSGLRELPDLNIPEVKYPTQTTKTHSVHRKEGSGTRPKSSMLDKAIKELEKSVTESRPPNLDVQDADTSSQNVKRRLPREIKQKLSKVARLASTNGKMSKELIHRLDKILGHLVQLRTLKRNLKIMINSSLSAKQEKDNRFQQIKKEVAEIIKMQFPSPKSKVSNQVLGASDDFQETGIEEKTVMKKKYSMDSVMEDKICDLYDLYVDGLDEDSGPQIRKLYAELAEMWPNGFIDNHGIKRAICRAKDRRKTLYNLHKDLEKNDRKLLARVEASSVAQPQQVRERLPSDHGNHGVASPNRPISGITTTTTAALRVPSPTVSGPYVERPKPERMKGSLATSQSDGKLTEGTLIKKKVKRKPEHGVGEGQFRHEKSLSAPNQDRSYKQAVLKPNVQSAPPPSAEQ